MLAKQRNDGAPGSTEKNLGLPGSGQPPFGTLIYKLSYFAWDTCASVPFLRQRYTLRILGDPGAVSRVDKMFVVKVYCKIETSSYILSTRLTAAGSPRMHLA